MDDTAELIKWMDVLNALAETEDEAAEVEKARACRHPDARWLASLFPPASVTRERMYEVLSQQSEDPRAMHIMRGLGVAERDDAYRLLVRAAEMGYAPAQAALSEDRQHHKDVAGRFLWAERAAIQGDSGGLYELGCCYWHGEGCEKDTRRGIELFKKGG
jgi:TPR repeat protein